MQHVKQSTSPIKSHHLTFASPPQIDTTSDYCSKPHCISGVGFRLGNNTEPDVYTGSPFSSSSESSASGCALCHLPEFILFRFTFCISQSSGSNVFPPCVLATYRCQHGPQNDRSIPSMIAVRCSDFLASLHLMPRVRQDLHLIRES
jgi:hypothetical protein